ncbi:anti-repressor SinI family protein [Rossellomorea marisflavi]|nr:anti-repressor SinI family protein [Rossellomorea marisflavi]WJV20751.1 anti-repressor SinI family protein [Rossellomorea marisflavi]
MNSKTPLEEWYELIMEAREVGISVEEVRRFIQNMKNNNN